MTQWHMRAARQCCYTAGMLIRRILFVVLTMIALQLSWTAISAYCMHESGKAAQHFGHHQHTETPDELAAADHDAPSAAKKAAPHAHCGSCAHTTLSPVLLPDLLVIAAARDAAPAGLTATLTSTYPRPPERPQWSRAA